MTDPGDQRPDPRAFRTTRWTRVMAARGDSADARTALSELCEIYYAPVRAFIGHAWRGEDPDDLTQAFFARLLERANLEQVDRERGRFRSYLLGAVKHFIRDHRAKLHAEKRGGSAEHVGVEDAGLSVPAPSEALFDREWAVALIARAFASLEAGESSPRTFEVLKPWLHGAAADLSQAGAAAELGISEGAVKVAIHRLRKRFRRHIRSEIAQTVPDAGEISGELNYLIEVLGGREA
ncbi:MAG: sigma-70 family RNA polymerase sigma factor [Akkermansiaceae bacterium]|nr:sigma-70 family RNA polymerase sigma factor [Akkermansiaceae bacterium]NNM31217.1 sigma-70 family RNA polymerase sigma factor [Akkermansiaceae bacterium]